jgi:hypothetical protein
MTSREWILQQLDMREDELLSPCRRKEYAEKRWVVIWFYRAAGKSYPFIARKVGKDQSSIRHACRHASATTKMLAEEYLRRYITEVLHEEPEIKETLPPEKKIVWVKRPDYKHSRSVMMEVEVEE